MIAKACFYLRFFITLQRYNILALQYMMKIQIINGPNLNLLGVREPSIYGSTSIEDYIKELKSVYSNIEIDYYQSNVEGEIINKLHEVGFSYDGVVLNAGGYTHTSVAIADAIAAIKTPVVEVHVSNIYAREEYRHVSLTGKNCQGVLTGFGMKGYRLAIESLLI
jgi:3-dehydroquinate dehydratase-2